MLALTRLSALVTTSRAWRVFIGKPGVSGKLTDLGSFPTICSDGQKRPVFIYRFLTAGTIDGAWTSYPPPPDGQISVPNSSSSERENLPTSSDQAGAQRLYVHLSHQNPCLEH